MIDFRAVLRATIVGIVIQFAMVTVTHFFKGAAPYYLFALMMISATAGYIYAADTGRGYFPGATAGAIAGGACGFLALGLTALLHDILKTLIPVDTAICVLTGAVGGLWGQLSAVMRRAGW